MQKTLIFFVLLLSFNVAKAQIIANPLNLNYRFQQPRDEGNRTGGAFREAADPEIHIFEDKYYLFASHSGGYWRSDNLADWTYIPINSIDIIGAYAPTVLVLGDTLYYMASGSPRIFATTNPDKDEWWEYPSQLGLWETDPAFFLDEEAGRVYLYWGCSDKNPIMGVEVDPKNGFKPIGEPKVLISHNIAQHGWENPGENNERNHNGWNEGASMIKHNGKYYLQYAAPGTEFRIYADGVYTADSPLGDFVYEPSSPFSFKPGGFIGGAGHGHTFYDKYGNLWHVATMRISVRHMFERRIGLFPAYFADDGTLHAHTVWTDYPFQVPQERVDIEKDDLFFANHLLSYNRKVKSSSYLKNYEPQKANDEQIETWWSAESGKAGEWFQLDLGREELIYSIQVNFADHDFPFLDSFAYQYKILCSDNGKKWETLVDRSNNEKDMPHELIVLDEFAKTRFLRIVNTKDISIGKFSLYDLRTFSFGSCYEFKTQNFSAVRDENDKRIYRFKWEEKPEAQGYILRWGVKPDDLDNAMMIRGTEFEGRFFNVDSEYYFGLTSFQ